MCGRFVLDYDLGSDGPWLSVLTTVRPCLEEQQDRRTASSTVAAFSIRSGPIPSVAVYPGRRVRREFPRRDRSRSHQDRSPILSQVDRCVSRVDDHDHRATLEGEDTFWRFEELNTFKGSPESVISSSMERAAVHLERRSVDAVLRVDGEAAELGRLRQPALSGFGEPECGGVLLPWERHAAAIAAGHAGALVGGVFA